MRITDRPEEPGASGSGGAGDERTEPESDGAEPDAPARLRPPRHRRLSLAGRITAGFFLVLVLMAALAAGATRLPELSPWAVFLAVLLVGLPLGAWMIGRLLAPLDRVVRGVADGIRSFRDGDFSTRLAYRRDDELGELVELFNQVGQTLSDERQAVRQRELLLQTALDRSPAAILLAGQSGRIVYSNLEARRLLLAGGKLEGLSLAEIRAGCPPEMQEILDAGTDGLFTVTREEENETYHLAQRTFQLNRRRHTLLLLRRLTGELGRQEAEIWKKVIRVISHELNNSLAPVSSLVYSAHKIAREPRHAGRADQVFTSIRERLDHLRQFIEGYARFARLPRPRKQKVDWAELVAGLDDYPFELVGNLPTSPGLFDPAQLRQVVVNLLKNAVEASDGEPRVTLRIKSAGDGTFLQVADRGRGMDEETMEKALLPFYSTKKTGTGLGLPLCREILEAHGGKLSLQAGEGGGTVVTCWLPEG